MFCDKKLMLSDKTLIISDKTLILSDKTLMFFDIKEHQRFITKHQLLLNFNESTSNIHIHIYLISCE